MNVLVMFISRYKVLYGTGGKLHFNVPSYIKGFLSITIDNAQIVMFISVWESYGSGGWL